MELHNRRSFFKGIKIDLNPKYLSRILDITSPLFLIPPSIIIHIITYTYSMETTYGINSVISKLMTFVENAETGQFLFLMMRILSCFTWS
jgi:hypothetical protein